MRINPISTKTCMKNFSGEFKEQVEDVEIDETQRYEFSRIYSVYHPNKNETEKEINEAMKKYSRLETPQGKPNWSYIKVYTCSRGDRLPY